MAQEVQISQEDLLPSQQQDVNINNNSATTPEQPQVPLCRITLLDNLDGIHVYTDAFISPDQNQPINRNAVIGVFFVCSNLGHLKAHLASASSVFMAEAAALALAGTIIRNLGINEASFVFDNQQLVTYMDTNSNEEIPR
jgi:hypothetical protein